MEQEFPESLKEIFNRPLIVNHDLVESKSVSAKIKEYNQIVKNKEHSKYPSPSNIFIIFP